MTLLEAQMKIAALDQPPIDPVNVLRAWPDDRPVGALLSAPQASCGYARWSILAFPEAPAPAASLRDALAMTGALAPDRHQSASDMPPFQGGVIGWISYDAARRLEPVAQAPQAHRARDDRNHPEHQLFRVDHAFAFDHDRRIWWRIGDPPDLESLFSRARRIESDEAFHLGPVTSSMGRDAYESAVARVKELIAAGDVFQANIAHRLTAEFKGSPRALAARLLQRLGSWYAACIESTDPGACVISASPELFLEFDPRDRRVTTRPIKGTIPADHPIEKLESSEKDQAELAMIVDLMRNDLGRVCDFGSIHVDQPRTIERHGGVGKAAASGVHHAVATVHGRLRDDQSIADLLEAAFPPGSITGAPKIRAMQIIDELEPVRRGPYCGAVGYISDCGRAAFNVAIRTAAITPHPDQPRTGSFNDVHGLIDYSVGAGIVADSSPEAEWLETLAKAEGFLKAVDRNPPT